MTWSGSDQGGSGQYGGLGVFSGEPASTPPSNRNRKIIIAALSVVIVIGLAAVVVLLVNRNSGPGTNTAASSTTSAAKPTTTTPKPSGPKVISNVDSAMRYEVPANWQVPQQKMSRNTAGAIITGMAAVHPFNCGPENRQFIRAEVGSGSTTDPNLEAAALAVAKSLAINGYTVGDKTPPQITVQPTKDVQRGAVAGKMVTVDAVAKQDECNAPRGRLIAMAFPTTMGTSVFMLNVSYEGKDAQFSPSDSEVKRILDSVQITS